MITVTLTHDQAAAVVANATERVFALRQGVDPTEIGFFQALAQASDAIVAASLAATTEGAT